MSRQQSGYIWRVGNSWFGRWREDVLKEGKIIRKQRCKRLADYGDRYKTERDVQPLLDDVLRPLNEGRTDVRSTLTLASFVSNFYLPYALENLKPSTHHGYVKLWKDSLAPRIGEIRLRDFRTVDAAKLLNALVAKGWGRRSLQHAKSLVSGIFTYAKNLGVLDGVNPVRDTLVPKKAAAPAETHATTPEEVMAMLKALSEAPDFDPRQRIQAQAAIGLMYFAGLRPGEARGIRWEDYDGRKLQILRSVWRTHTTPPKTEAAAKPVPVIEPLRELLAELRAVEANPESGPILRGVLGRPLDLNMLAKRVVVPVLSKTKIPWHEWYALRRGIGTLTATLAKDANAAKGLLRHSSLAITLGHYVKIVPEVTERAMRQVEQLFSTDENAARQ
jgi:integrase